VTANTTRSWQRVRSAILPILFVSATLALLATRVISATAHPEQWPHVLLGAASLAALVVLRHGGFARAAAYAVAIECVGGVAIFATIDAPAVLANTPAIVRAVALVAPHGLR
jgi:hypothetical protein